MKAISEMHASNQKNHLTILTGIIFFLHVELSYNPGYQNNNFQIVCIHNKYCLHAGMAGGTGQLSGGDCYSLVIYQGISRQSDTVFWL